jgi:arylsulfatase A-like enzyme
LYAAQQEGRSIDDPARLFSDAAKIGEKLSLTRFPGHAAWLDGVWKLHRMEDREEGGVTWELYQLAEDPKESRNVADDHSARVAAMRKDLESWLQSVARSHNGEDYQPR